MSRDLAIELSVRLQTAVAALRAAADAARDAGEERWVNRLSTAVEQVCALRSESLAGTGLTAHEYR